MLGSDIMVFLWQDLILCTTSHARLGWGLGFTLLCGGRGVAPTVTRQRAANSAGVWSPGTECGPASWSRLPRGHSRTCNTLQDGAMSMPRGCPLLGLDPAANGAVQSVAHLNHTGLTSCPLRIQPQMKQGPQRSRFTRRPTGGSEIAQGKARRRPGYPSRNPPPALEGRNAVPMAKCRTCGTEPIGLSIPAPPSSRMFPQAWKPALKRPAHQADGAPWLHGLRRPAFGQDLGHVGGGRRWLGLGLCLRHRDCKLLVQRPNPGRDLIQLVSGISG